MNFSTLDLAQDTEPWPHWRSDGVGGSDAVVIDGWTKYKSLEQLIQEKVNRRVHVTQDAAALAGKHNEVKARFEAEKQLGVRLTPPICIQSNIYPWLRASLDAADFTRQFIVEIKCGPGQYRNHEGTRAVVPWISVQIQHCLAVTGFDYGYAVFWQPCARPIIRKVKRNVRLINKLLDKEQEFWFEVERRRSLPSYTSCASRA